MSIEQVDEGHIEVLAQAVLQVLGKTPESASELFDLPNLPTPTVNIDEDEDLDDFKEISSVIRTRKRVEV